MMHKEITIVFMKKLRKGLGSDTHADNFGISLYCYFYLNTD